MKAYSDPARRWWVIRNADKVILAVYGHALWDMACEKAEAITRDTGIHHQPELYLSDNKPHVGGR